MLGSTGKGILHGRRAAPVRGMYLRRNHRVNRMLGLVGQPVRPSFTLAIVASGSVGLSQSPFDRFLPVRLRSRRTRSSALGVSMPLSLACGQHLTIAFATVARHTIVRGVGEAAARCAVHLHHPLRQIAQPAANHTLPRRDWTLVDQLSRLTLSRLIKSRSPPGALPYPNQPGPPH